MAVYAEDTPGNSAKFDLYIGSDVAQVWKATGILKSDLLDVSNYHYNYIRNHKIMRFQ